MLFFIGFQSCQDEDDLPTATQGKNDEVKVVLHEENYVDIVKVMRDFHLNQFKLIRSAQYTVYEQGTNINFIKLQFEELFKPNEKAELQFSSEFETGFNYNFVLSLMVERNIYDRLWTVALESNPEELNISIRDAKRYLFENRELPIQNKLRLFAILANIESIYEAMEKLRTLESNGIELRNNCWNKIGQAAVVGGITGGLYGLYSGCKTGIVLGFNPGSAAAGCLGGYIIGTLGGAVKGSIAGAVGCYLFGGGKQPYCPPHQLVKMPEDGEPCEPE